MSMVGKRRTGWLLLVGMVAVLVLAACASNSTPTSVTKGEGRPVTVEGGMYRDISVADLQAMLQEEDFVLVNVHEPFEGNIPGTDLSIPFNQIAQQADQLPQDKDAKVVVCCRSGAMSAIAARALVQMGYTNVWNLDGGMNAWRQAGLPLEATP